jgi:hypothetical protein
MNDNFQNEREWRNLLFEEVKEIRKGQKELISAMEGLKVKVAYISSGIALAVGIISSIIVAKF